MSEQVDTLIIGAGPAGLGVALELQRDFLLVEKASDLGGVSGTLEWEGATFDLGGHSFHTPHPEVRSLVFNALEMSEQKREARCFVRGQMIDYPFQKNFRSLSHQDIVEDCIHGLDEVHTQRKDGTELADYRAFIESRFGSGIARHFMLPYNEKLWGRDLRKLTASWTAERVAAPEGVKESFQTSGGARKPLQSDTLVAYPARGGFGEIFKALGRDIKAVRYQCAINRINHHEKKAFTLTGESIEYKRLVSSLPLTELVNLLVDAPDHLNRWTSELDYLSLKVALIVINHPVDTPIQRVYSAEAEIAAHKTAINHNSSDFLRSQPRHGIMAEVSYSPDKPLGRADLAAWVIENLLSMQIIKSKSEVHASRVLDLRYAYPVPSHGRESAVQALKGWLGGFDIYSVGRFGDWAYINSDEVLHRGLTLGRKIASLRSS